MPRKVIQKFFDAWRGIHEGLSEISKPAFFSDVAQNVVRETDGSLRQRPGWQWAAGYDHATARATYSSGDQLASLIRNPAFLLGPGLEKNQLITLGGDARAAGAGSLSIVFPMTHVLEYTGVNANPRYTWEVVATNEYQLTLETDSGVDLQSTYSPTNTLGDVATAIAATGDWTLNNCRVPTQTSDSVILFTETNVTGVTPVSSLAVPTGSVTVDGAGQNNVTVITVLNTSSVSEGDWLYFTDQAYGMTASAEILSKTATTITIEKPVDVSDAQVLTSGAPFEKFYPMGGDDRLSTVWQGKPRDPDFRNSNLVSLNDSIYVAHEAGIFGSPDNLPVRWDGASVLSLMPDEVTMGVLALAGSGGVLGANVTYSYRIRTVRIDSAGKEEFSDFSEASSVTTGSPGPSAITVPLSLPSPGSPGVVNRSFDYTATVVSGTRLTIANPGGFKLMPGWRMYFEVTSGGFETRQIIKVISDTVIEVDSPISVTSGDMCSFYKVEVYRTIGDGLIYYLTTEVVPPRTISNNMTDTVLQGQPRLVENVVDWSGPPNARLAASHQELLVLSGNNDSPNSIYYSDVAGPYVFPEDNEVEVRFGDESEITCVHSAGSLLAAFKTRGRALISGDFTTGNVFVEIFEDGIGCPSSTGAIKGERALYFVSETGIQRLTEQVFTRDDTDRLDSEFSNRTVGLFNQAQYRKQREALEKGNAKNLTDWDDTVLFPNRATSAYDPRRNLVIFFIPALDQEDVYRPNANSLFIVYDEVGDAVFTWKASNSVVNAMCGMVMHMGRLYLKTLKETFDTAVRDEMYIMKEADIPSERSWEAADGLYPIEFKVNTQWDFAGEPSVFKKFVRMKVWKFAKTLFNPFSLRIRTYLDFDDTTAHTEYTETFNAITEREKRGKLKSNRCRSIMFEFYNNTLHEAPQISGYEYEASGNFEGEEIQEGDG